MEPQNYRYLCEMVYRESGIVLDESKHYLVEARLTPVARDAGAGDLNALCNLMRAISGRPLRDKVVEAMTTNETLFFRDIKPFDALRQVILPELTAKRRPVQTLRVLSAACSTGQEAYSLAMLWKEMKIPGWDLDILGIDLSDEVLDKARGGRYQQLEVNRGLPAMYLVKYFQRDEAVWQIKSEIRSMARWRKFNLLDDLTPLGTFDLILCRNVLIYFDQPTKSRILGAFRGRLISGGYLFLGASETTLNLDDKFLRRQVASAIAYQKP
ncbi:MAG: chemotaxis protein CheR [Acidobacteria bacterium]|nr:chemotaxis protein CheR [Acidobacteriota bacterium]